MSGNSFGWLKTAAEVSVIPMLILVSTLIGLGLGIWLDGKLGTKPWLAVVLTILGLAAGIYETAKILAKVARGDGDR